MIEKELPGNSLAVQWLKLYTFTANDLGLIPGHGAKIAQATWCSHKKKKKKSCVWLRDPMDYGPAGSSVHGILQARILEWVAILLQGIFLTQGLNSHLQNLLYWQVDSLALWHLGSPPFQTKISQNWLSDPILWETDSFSFFANSALLNCNGHPYPFILVHMWDFCNTNLDFLPYM